MKWFAMLGRINNTEVRQPISFRTGSEVSAVDPGWAWSDYTPSAQVPWNRRRAAHLLRRVGMGFRWLELEESLAAGPAAMIDRLCDLSVNQKFDHETDPIGLLSASAQEPRRLSSWWLLRMAQIPNALLEKLTLFWHGHFATSGEKVRDNRALHAQNELLRRNGLGNFSQLVGMIARDPAMLIYLDTTDNRKTRPNENFAREVMELFCLGPGNYSENDIKELARCFTGWEVRGGRFHFNSYQHDEGVKTIFGEQGNFGADEALSRVLAHRACGLFVARQLVRFYLADEMELSDRLLEPLAHQFRENGGAIEPLVRRILGSNLFFSNEAITAKIRGPVELAIFLIRSLRLQVNLDQLAGELETLGQLLYFPPNVKGWEGGRSWINAATLLGRNQLARQLVGRVDPLAKGGDRAFPAGFLQLASDEFVQQIVEGWLSVDLPAAVSHLLHEVAEQNRSQPAKRLTETLKVVVSLPEFQLG